MTLQSAEKRPQTQQAKQNEKAKNYPTDEGTQLKKKNPNQTKEEETGSLPEKELRIMIVKMILKLENKMELQ